MQLIKRSLLLCTSCAFLIAPFFTQAHEGGEIAGIQVEKLLETEKSWDGVLYQAYPAGTPQLSVLKITLAPDTSFEWHEHPMPNAAYVLNGSITIEKKANGEKQTFRAGEVLAEVVDSTHRGYTGKESATLIVFYAGKKGLTLTKPAE